MTYKRTGDPVTDTALYHGAIATALSIAAIAGDPPPGSRKVCENVTKTARKYSAVPTSYNVIGGPTRDDDTQTPTGVPYEWKVTVKIKVKIKINY